MKLYLRTPLFQNSQTLQHLLEHCIFQTLDLDVYFNLFCGLSGACYRGYTLFEDIRDIDLFWNLIKTFPDKKTLEYEKGIIIDELKEKKRSHILLEKVGKLLYGNSFTTNSLGKYTLSQLREYHHRYFENPSYILTDDQKNILEMKNINPVASNDRRMSIPLKFDIMYKKGLYNFWCWKLYNENGFYFVDFLLELLMQYNKYFNRHINGKYDYVFIGYYEYVDYSVIRVPSEYNFKITEEFFQKFKQYYIDNIFSKEFDGKKLIMMIRRNRKPDIDSIREFIFNIKYKEIGIIGNISISKNRLNV